MNEYLESTEIIDWKNPEVLTLARALAAEHTAEEVLAKAAFEWVRDNVSYTMGAQRGPVTCAASEVLRHRTGPLRVVTDALREHADFRVLARNLPDLPISPSR